MGRVKTIGAIAAAAALAQAGPAQAQGFELSALYKADAAAVVSGGVARGARLLGNGEIAAEADLETLAGWSSARAGLRLLAVHGGDPNALAGTIQGVNNIEVPHDRAKLYEIWIEQAFAGGRVSLLAGMADLNADFYQNDAAGLLIAPAFGIGSELAATGPNGPSIFPSTALGARLRVTPGGGLYAQAGIYNAKAGVLGDRGGVDLRMRDGALAIGEAGLGGSVKLALGYWRYTRRQDDIRELGPDGGAARRIAQGGYALAELPVAAGVSAFARAGLSDGDTTPYRGGWQAGLLASGIVPGRPHGQLSVGVNQAWLGAKFRANALDEGRPLGRTETGFEITYADRLAPFLTVQPDVQYVLNPSADPAVRDALLLGIRFTFAFGVE